MSGKDLFQAMATGGFLVKVEVTVVALQFEIAQPKSWAFRTLAILVLDGWCELSPFECTRISVEGTELRVSRQGYTQERQG